MKMTQPRKHGEIRRWVYSPQALLDTVASLNPLALPQTTVEALGETSDSFRLMLGRHYTREQKGKLLFDAIEANDHQKIVQLVRGCNTDVNDLYELREDYDMSPLLFALGNGGTLQTMRLLLRLGADPNKNERVLQFYGGSPLFMRSDILDVFSLLIDHGANIDKQRALHFAVLHDQTNMVKLFIKRGANINLVLGGNTPLSMTNKTYPMYNFLRSQGAKHPHEL
jgi:hypothetical protein